MIQVALGMRSVWPFLLLFCIPMTVTLAMLLQGWALLATPVLAFFLIPIFNQILGDDNSQFVEPSNAGIKLGRVLCSLYLPFQLILIIFGARQAQISNWNWWQWSLVVLSMGLATGGIGITVAHELVHRSEVSLRSFGGLLLSSVCYGHFMVEHVHGHHTWVATEQDPASSRLNESIYAFYPRTILGGFVSGWRIESQRLKKRNLSLMHHRIIITWTLSVVMGAGLFLAFGFKGLLFFILQSWMAISLLEMINYVEHYGLSRKKNQDGTYEPVALRHSWDSRRKVSNWVLINLQRHSDHHKYPMRDFPKLRFHEEAPLLPGGYPEMLMLALVPPLWFAIINQRINAAD